ncbi:hypothetical protein [Parasitella parasitica]|uniref:RGS domain-containing protein n=1 Tax=Parasitella parasitica TaxID=35722 RepID=A0A0B7MYE1_9FUNG|nr:hypothetical protein [Parasitella parasitica]
MTKNRRPSHTSQTSGSSTIGSNEVYLSARTRKSISKSRRSSTVLEEKPASRRTSIAAAFSLLSLPSFNEQLNTVQILNALDVHAMYKIKINKSQQKLEYFFGEPTPVDVCISEINKEGLKAMLESKVPLCYFLYHLLNEFSSENLFFFLQVEQFENCTKKSSKKQKDMARRIYDTYISRNSYLEINLDDRVKRKIEDQMTDANYDDIFNEAQASAYIMLESSLMRFVNTTAYRDMVDTCGEFNIYYDSATRSIALNYLTQFLRDQHNMVLIYSRDDSPLGNSLTDMNKQHYDLTKAGLKGFIKDLFGVDYFGSNSSSAFSVSSCSSTKSPHSPSTNKRTQKKKVITRRKSSIRL